MTQGSYDGGERAALRREIDACAAKLSMLTAAGYDRHRLEEITWELRSRKHELERRLAEMQAHR